MALLDGCVVSIVKCEDVSAILKVFRRGSRKLIARLMGARGRRRDSFISRSNIDRKPPFSDDIGAISQETTVLLVR